MEKGNADTGALKRDIREFNLLNAINSRALGQKVTTFGGFDTFDRPAGVYRVSMISKEVTAVCPVTGQPDWYEVEIEYAPDKKCIESKTMKLYLQSFRQEGLFCEAFADKIAEDVFQAILPVSVDVRVTQVPRGGVAIVAIATRPYSKPKGEGA